MKAHCIDHDVGLQNKDQLINNTFIERNNTNCPRFNISTREIFIPDGSALTFGRTGAVNIFPISLRSIIQKHYRCVLTRSNGIPLITIGRLNESSLLCDPFQVRLFTGINFMIILILFIDRFLSTETSVKKFLLSVLNGVNVCQTVRLKH